MFKRKRKVIAIDLGGTNLRVSLVENDEVTKYIKKKTPDNKNDLLRAMSESIKELISKDVKGIGVSCAGPLRNGVIKNPPHLPLKNFNLQGYLAKKFKKKCVVENDANCVAIAESKLGVQKKNFFVLTLGTGIGGGIIINGELYNGCGYAAELGHIVMNDEGKDFETKWKDMRKKIYKKYKRKLLVRDLLEINDKDCKRLIDEITTILAQGIASHINSLDPEIVIIAGGISETGEIFMNKIRKKVPQYVINPKRYKIIWSSFYHPGTIGASLLI